MLFQTFKLQLLLEYGADYNAETIDKWTPLHSACHWNSAPCAEKLICLGLNVNAQSQGGIQMILFIEIAPM